MWPLVLVRHRRGNVAVLTGEGDCPVEPGGMKSVGLVATATPLLGSWGADTEHPSNKRGSFTEGSCLVKGSKAVGAEVVFARPRAGAGGAADRRGGGAVGVADTAPKSECAARSLNRSPEGLRGSLRGLGRARRLRSFGCDMGKKA